MKRFLIYFLALLLLSAYAAAQSMSGRLVRMVAYDAGIKLPIAPIVKSVRSQGEPFNNACPYYIYDDGMVSQERSLVGCVATSAEQVLSHYCYPDALLDSIAGFTTRNHGTIATIPAGTELDFGNILNLYEEGLYTDDEAEAVANLSYYLGVACHMNWAVGSSGAQVSRLVEPLKRAFGYRYVRYLCSYDYSPQRWIALLLNELANGRPIVYAGYASSGSGHAFVIDGVSKDGKFHATWGFGGHNDGYFDLAVLNNNENPLDPTLEGAVEGLNHMQEALFLYPDSVPYVINDTLPEAHRIEVDTVMFNRSPDTNMYTIASVKVRNLTDDYVFAPVELFTYSELDTLGRPVDTDYLGAVDAILPAAADTTLLAYIRFSATGPRMLGIAIADTVYLPYDSLMVSKASQPRLSYALNDSTLTATTATFTIDIENLSPLYWSGRMVTYSVFEGPYTEVENDLRHYTVLNLPPQAATIDSVTFTHLKPSTDYTLVVRNPWQPALQVEFHTPAATAINEVESTGNLKTQNPAFKSYRLNHRIVIQYDESTGRYRQILSPQR
ncbi:MAG: C10 family peptidase [Bacteroidaceae bacterium]|nr:C10 family peptidase [Bacteroidaceae bacterium]